MIPKFRVYIKNLKMMLPVDNIDFVNKTVAVQICKDDFMHNDPHEYDFNDENIVVMQSTGLKDKNRVEICEGDIVKPVSLASWIGVVKYSSENAAYILDDHNNEFVRSENVYLSQFNEGLEVLGNIYENPGLMEV